MTRRQRKGGILVKGLSAGIGFASEYIHFQKEQNANKSKVTVTEQAVQSDADIVKTVVYEPEDEHDLKDLEPPPYDEASEKCDHDLKEWRLDEAQDEVSSALADEKPKTFCEPTKRVAHFTAKHPPPETVQYYRLSLPVVLPQRRPKDRTRGFIRAYAPALEGCGIDQDTFVEFIEVFNAATLAAPWIDAINLASLALVTLPTAISQAASVAISIAVDITKNMQSRYRHRYILDQMNNDFFRPRGLYALVLTWNPNSSAIRMSVNLNETIADNISARDSLFDKAKHNFRPSMGNTVGTAFSETAPLVFPLLDSLVNNQTPEAKTFMQKMKTTQSFVADYMDRRAQAQHIGDHPNSQLAVTKPVFKSRYSDPNSAANSGGLVALVSGGNLLLPRNRRRLAQRSQSSGNQFPSNSDYGARGGLITGGIRRVFQHHVLYLAIINMPTDAELAEATEYLKTTEGFSQN